MTEYTVQGLRLVPQSPQMACWYAAAQMLVQWRRNRFRPLSIPLPDAAADPTGARLAAMDQGLHELDLVEQAKRLGLSRVPQMDLAPDTLAWMLQTYGPLWVLGRTHPLVIGGVYGEDL